MHLLVAVAVAMTTGQAATWPPGPSVRCAWNPLGHSLDLVWKATKSTVPADIYEIQIAEARFARAAAVFTTGALNASLGPEVLIPGTTYWVSVRAHAGWAFATGHGMGADTWGNIGPVTECATVQPPHNPPTPDPSTQSAPGLNANAAAAAGAFTLEAWRISEYTTDVDYPGNHDTASLLGSSLLVTVLAQFESLEGTLALHDSWTGAATKDIAITAFCIDALPPRMPRNDTTRGDPRFADYASCNNQPDKSASNCTCAVAADRQWGRLPLAPDCHLENSTWLPCPASGADCVCRCSAQGSAGTAAYTGMVDVFALDDKDDAPIGRWYSHPLAAACHSHEPLGSPRPDGSVCSWKARQLARVLRGWQLYSAGLNSTGLNCDPAGGVGESCAPDAAQIRQNAGVMRAVVDAAALKAWRCA